MLENIGSVITRYRWTNWDETWVVAFNQHLCRKTVSLVLVVIVNRTVNVLVLGGCRDQKHPQF